MVSTLRRPRFPWRGIYPAVRKFLLVTPFQSYRIILEPRRCKLNRVSQNKDLIVEESGYCDRSGMKSNLPTQVLREPLPHHLGRVPPYKGGPW